MKYYVVTALIILQQMAADYPQLGIVPMATTRRYENGDTVWVADGRFVDTCEKYHWGRIQDITLSNPVTNRGILTYKTQLADSEIVK